MRIFMEARERATAITVVNEGDTELVMQAELFTGSRSPMGSTNCRPPKTWCWRPRS
ncbi:hypothetical protein HK414_03220 [Ramlibacter terrae]|uniref:Uncharacterized protein n=1 Tax=Ramlibacter terrae TaxID=2732511 RepID=A0ABX6P0F4_9BURK|nr:hypothetical protein HK414_03220 [Ramlibacter terrae]